MNEKKVVILGAGISGLATAYWLYKDGYDVSIIEEQSKAGGAMQTLHEENFLVDFGPNSGLETTPLIRKLVEEVGLSDEMIYASETSSKRFIFREGSLHALPMGFVQFLSTKLFSLNGKLRLFKEPFVGKSSDGYYQSIAQFVERRLGKEFLDYAIDPFVSGVFAGDPAKLSVKSAFPKLYRLEEVYGGLVKGLIKGARERKKSSEESKQSAKMFSFMNGMQTFPKAIANKLDGRIILNSVVKKVEKQNDKWVVLFENNGSLKKIECNKIISTVPSFVASEIFGNLDAELTIHLNSVYYPPVIVLYLAFNKKDIGTPLDGFGFLIPSLERKNFLGAIWSSTIFPNRCSEDKAGFTLFIGGARNQQILKQDTKQLIDTAVTEFKEMMKTKAEPVYLKSKMWSNAIPQYNLGYIEHENYFEKFEKNNPGIFLSGNYRGGISVGDCIKNSDVVARKVMEN
ncbi:MAG: protoporphyrinogen oxidase [Ignavibacteria bacterium]|nr:MAG: protoporphyrinogen oxidase [Ignavibacteria bacterium]KAF0161005.1 MAG: protoporphyrinogen oxidase [Ignavibacteria bacterium]